MASDEQIHNGDENLMTYTYDRNRVFKVMAGTRCAYVQLRPRQYEDPNFASATRDNCQATAMQIAVRLWETRWGEPLPWDCAQFLVSHTTLQVVVELRVDTP